MDGEIMYVKRCVDCGASTIVKDSRERPDGAIFRRRACPKCGFEFRTIEVEECISEIAGLLDDIEALKKENDRLKETMRTARINIEKILTV